MPPCRSFPDNHRRHCASHDRQRLTYSLMHDAGFGYHVGPDGLSLSVVGARARHAGKFNVEKFLGPKA